MILSDIFHILSVLTRAPECRCRVELLVSSSPIPDTSPRKYKLVKEVTPKDRSDLLHDYAREEQNMFYLRHPYLTVEQSRGHALALKKKEQWLDNFRKVRTEYKDHFTMEMQYSHLKVKDAWE